MKTVFDEIEVKTAFFSMKKNGIVYMRIKENAEIDVHAVNEHYDAIRKISGKNKSLLLLDPGPNCTATTEAKIYAASHKDKPILAEAIIAKSLVYKLLGNFYIRFNKPIQATKLFSNEEEAIKWLKSFSKN